MIGLRLSTAFRLSAICSAFSAVMAGADPTGVRTLTVERTQAQAYGATTYGQLADPPSGGTGRSSRATSLRHQAGQGGGEVIGRRSHSCSRRRTPPATPPSILCQVCTHVNHSRRWSLVGASGDALPPLQRHTKSAIRSLSTAAAGPDAGWRSQMAAGARLGGGQRWAAGALCAVRSVQRVMRQAKGRMAARRHPTWPQLTAVVVER